MCCKWISLVAGERRKLGQYGKECGSGKEEWGDGRGWRVLPGTTLGRDWTNKAHHSDNDYLLVFRSVRPTLPQLILQKACELIASISQLRNRLESAELEYSWAECIPRFPGSKLPPWTQQRCWEATLWRWLWAGPNLRWGRGHLKKRHY